MRLFFLIAFILSPLLAQENRPGTVSLGFKIGSPLNDPASQTFYNSTYSQSRWTGGPTAELHLPFRFAVEFDALYWANRSNSSQTFQYAPNLNPYSFATSQRTSAWDFPILIKYRFQIGSIRPFISAGYIFTRESTEHINFGQCLGPQGSCAPAESSIPPNPSYYNFKESGFGSGPAAGAGLEFRTKLVTITPELRFSRLINTYPRDNRFTGLVGFTFGRK